MFEDLFEFSDNIIPEAESSGMITFEEYLQKKNEGRTPLDVSFSSFNSNTIIEKKEEVEDTPGMITFEEYLQRKSKNESLLDTSFVNFNLDGVTEDSVPESQGMMTFLEYLESKNLLTKEDQSSESTESPIVPINGTTNIGYTKKTLWDGYVQHVKFHAKKAPVVNIQDPKYLAESRAKYAEFLIEEQRKVWDKIYFFTPGGRPVEEEPETECAVIGKAVIGKNKIC